MVFIFASHFDCLLYGQPLWLPLIRLPRRAAVNADSCGKNLAGFGRARCNTGQMKEPNFKSDEEKLSGLLREARSTPLLPPRFQENVWCRIENGEKRSPSTIEVAWFDLITSWILRPQLALAAAVVLVLAGVGFGWNSGEQLARQDAQARYVAAVTPR